MGSAHGHLGGDGEPEVPIDPDLTEPVVVAGHRVGVIAAVALGGMLGATARFELTEAIPAVAGRFPWATFWTNMSGSFVLGVLLVVLLERFRPTRYVRPFLTTGILGAYTTMSTYMVETAVLIKDGHAATGLVYGIGSLVIGVALAAVGIATGRVVFGQRRA
jgi:fluoride exporter